jgi:hypothetical protein
MYETRVLGDARLELFGQLKSQVTFSDFCLPAGTIEFTAHQGLLSSSFCLFKLTYPSYELEVTVNRGMVFIRRNGHYQHSEVYTGKEACRVAVQWDSTSVACGVVPPSFAPDSMDRHMRAVRTPFTNPPIELVRTLRTNNLLSNAAYRNVDDLFATVVDAIHLSEADIRRHGGERFAWGKGGHASKPLDEPEISRLVAGFLSSHGGSKNFDVICESIAGAGNLDFYVSAPILNSGIGKIAIEAKKADSAQLIHGLEKQLPEYMARIGTYHGIYLTYWLKSEGYPYPSQASYAQLEIERLHPISRAPTVRTVGMNLSYGAIPSRPVT